jgi:hypothetical protein
VAGCHSFCLFFIFYNIQYIQTFIQLHSFNTIHPSAFAEASADINGLFAYHYCQQRAVTPDPESLNSNKKGAKLPLLSEEGWQHCPLITYQGAFFNGGETLR